MCVCVYVGCPCHRSWARAFCMDILDKHLSLRNSVELRSYLERVRRHPHPPDVKQTISGNKMPCQRRHHAMRCEPHICLVRLDVFLCYLFALLQSNRDKLHVHSFHNSNATCSVVVRTNSLREVDMQLE